MEVNVNELCHYGVEGMKWGIRRYQNKDGSLTPKGRRRLGYEDRRGYLTEKGHLVEKERRRKLTSAQSDSELKKYHDIGKRIAADNASKKDYDTHSKMIEEVRNHVVDNYWQSGKTDSTRKLISEKQQYLADFGSKTEKGRRFVKKYCSKMDSAVLSELGYSDTEAGRRYVRELWEYD